MARSRHVAIERFNGLKLQPGEHAAGDLAVADDVSLTVSGALASRVRLRLRAMVPAGSAGLYAVGTRVHVCAPSGTDISGLAPTVQVDLVSAEDVAAVHGVVADAQGRSLVLIERSSGVAELHQCRDANMEPVASTLVTLPFTPLKAPLVKLPGVGRVLALEEAANVRRLWASAVDDPDVTEPLRVWDPSADPDNAAKRGAFLDLGQHTAGAGVPVALAEYNGRAAVIYASAVQIWRMGADPENDAYPEQTVPGPGALRHQAVTGYGADVVMLTPQMAVQSMAAATLTMDARESGLGEDVEPLLGQLYDETQAPVVLYSRSRGQLLVAIGHSVLVLTMRPGGGKPVGWTRWRLPVAVEALAEVGKQVYLRSGAAVYSLEEAQDQGDEVSAGVYQAVGHRVETARIIRGVNQKTVQRVAAVCTETVRMQVVRDGRPALAEDGSLPAGVGTVVTLPPRAPEPSACSCGWPCRTVGIRIHDDACASSWRLEALYVDYLDAGHSGVT